MEDEEVKMYEVRIVEFPETMRVASYQYIGKNPEDKAMGNIVDWARRNSLLKGDRLPLFFGFNNPNPKEGDPVYGFEGWVIVGNEDVESDGLVGIRTVPGGKYAVMRAKGVEWKKFDPDGNWMKENGYEYDEKRQWLEGHIPNPEDIGEGSSGEPRWIAFDLCVPIKPAAEEGAVSGESDSFILEGVSPVGFSTYQWCPLSGCLRSCMEFLGEDYSYEYILSTAGSAYRLQWNSTKWDGGNVGITHMSEKPIEPLIRAFKAVGYDHEILIRKDFASGHDNISVSNDESVYRQRIISSIRDEGRPVIAIGVVGPPEPCIIAGYDEGGDVLIGWSYFQETPFEMPKEYFRKSNWFLETYGIITIGEKQEKPPLSGIYRNALRWALVVARTRRIREFHSGPAAYDAWAKAMIRDEDFPADNLNVLRNRLMVHYDAMCMVNNRSHAVKFLRQMAEHEPAMAEELTEAARLYEEEGKALGKMHEATGGYIPRNDDEKVKNLADPEARKKIAEAILQARDRDMEAADHIERALAKRGITEPRFEKRGDFRVLGIEDDAYKIEGVDPGFNDLWMNRFMSRHDDVQPYSTDGAYYAVWFGTKGTDISVGKHLAGMAVRSDANVPDGWVIRTVKAAEYAVFESNLRDVGLTTEYALDGWLPNSDYVLDADKPRFDLMPPNTTGPDSPVSVWIPVKRRS